MRAGFRGFDTGRRQSINALHCRQRRGCREDIDAVRIGAVSGLREQHRCLDTIEQLHDVGNGVVLVQ